MKKKMIFGFVALALAGCLKDPIKTEQKENGFSIDFLFEHEGIKMYRFRDGGTSYYFTNSGQVITDGGIQTTHHIHKR